MQEMAKIMTYCILCFLVVMYAVIASAEMTVTTKDGRKFSLPVNSGDIKRIDYSDAKGTETADAGGEGQYLGCFKDQGDATGTRGRDLSGHAVNNNGMTTARCVATCKDKGFQYAGTQYGSWCFCGNSYGKSGKATNCNMPCAGNKSEICGGSWANSVYGLDEDDHSQEEPAEKPVKSSGKGRRL